MMTTVVSGDAKWYFDPIKIPAGVYTYADQYLADENSLITVQYHNSDGTYTYQDIATVPVATNWSSTSIDFTVPANTQDITVFHLIEGRGVLTIDNVSVKAKNVASGIFTTGAVSLRFDDGWLSQYQNAVSKLNSVGLKGTFYIVSRRLADQGNTDFVSTDQVRDLYRAGHEIGAHTRTHSFLTQLTGVQQQSEIQGSRQDLLQLNVGAINSFAYPFGDYNDAALQMVKSAGFTSAAATIGGLIGPTDDPYQLRRFSVEVNVPISQIKQQIDQALANQQWLVLTFHRVDDSGEQYSVTPATFNQIVDYLVQKNVSVVTVSQGAQALL